MKFQDRKDAGQQLADKLNLTDTQDTVVLALPRGGIPLGIEVAMRYHLPLDLLLAKKIGHPSHSEYAIGALSEHGDPILDESAADLLDSEWLTTELKEIRNEIARRRRTYSKELTKQVLKNKTVLLVDDGIATGMTMKAAVKAVQDQEARRIVAAVPVIPKETYHELKKMTDEVIAVEVPDVFMGAVGAYYKHFPQVQDKEVLELLRTFKEQSNEW